MGFAVFGIAVGRWIGEVEPENVDFSVIGEKFADLIAHILRIAFHVASPVHFSAFFFAEVPVRTFAVVKDEILMVPVEERVVETDAEPLRTESVHHFPQKIASAFCTGDFVIGVL